MSLLHKTEKQQNNNDQLIRLMTPMIAGILACVFCLVSMTWAWFTGTVNTGSQTIQSANRSTSVTVYEISQLKEGNNSVTRTLVKPEISEVASLAKDAQATDEDASVVVAGESLVWNLSPEKSYEVVMTGSGTASTGYCKVALYHNVIENDEITPKTELYNTKVFGNKETFSFTYNTGGFNEQKGLTATQWKEYVENTTPPTLTIASYWGEPAKNEAEQVSLMSLRRTAKEEIMLLSDGDVIGLAPIPCPEAKAETNIELEGFEIQEGAEISAEEDYKISLTLKEGYEMPSEVVVNIGGKDYVVSTGGAEASNEAPYYDAQAGVLTVPSALLSDGIKVSVKATATLIPEEEPEEEETEEETTEEETEEDNSADTPSDNNVVADDPTKEDEEQSNDKPKRTPAGGGKDFDEADDDLEDSSTDNTSSSDNNEEEAEVEKADVTLNLSQLTINLEETQIPTNADLVLTLSAKEDMELPERIVITLDKTIRDENIEDEEITEDKTEYIINTDGTDNPEGFEFDVESGELKISSELLEGVREITIADIERNETDEDEEKTTITFEVKNLTFDFTDDEIVTDEDVVITFTAGEGYKLPETIMITIDDEEYIVYTSVEDSNKNPEGITFDMETGTLTISKDLLKDAEAITIAAEGIKEEDEEPEDTDADDVENEVEGGEGADKENESGTDAPSSEDKTETEGGTEVEGGENTEVTNPETNPDDTTENEDNGEDEGETETPEPDTEPDAEDNTNTEQGTEGGETEENGEDTTDPTPDTENGSNSETPIEPSEPVVTPETPKTETPDTSESVTGGNDDDNGETDNVDNTSAESSSNSGNDGTQSNEGTTSTLPGITTSTPATSQTSKQSSDNTSSTPASPTPSTNNDSNVAGTKSKETSSEE